MNKLEARKAAINYIVQGFETIEEAGVAYDGNRPLTKKKGRPRSRKLVNGVLLGNDEYAFYMDLVDFWAEASLAAKSAGNVMSDEEFVTFMKDAAPRLNKRMIDMALRSDDLRTVRMVASDLADRGYGKAASQLNINVSDKDIRSALKSIEDRGMIDLVPEVVVDGGS